MDIYTLSEKITQNHPLLKKYSPLVAQLLLNRSITETTAAEEFIKPSYTGNHDPLLLHNCEQAIDQIYSAIIHTKKIIIYADYDADGIPGAVVLSTLFDKIGYTNYDIYIPHRHDEGYGLHIEALEKCKNDGAELIITIDLGVTAIDQADWCNDNNIEFEVIPEYDLVHYFGEITKLFLGTQALTNDKHIICDPGTSNIVSECHIHKVPICLFLKSLKFSHYPASDQNIRKNSYKDECDGVEYNYSIHSNDVIKLDLIDHIITEKGEVSINDISSIQEQVIAQ